MSHFMSCIIVLKPTSFFNSFIGEQLSDFDYPKEDESEADHTAYVIPSCDSDDVLLEHLERLFPYMFRYEVARRLGKALVSRIKADFLDFLYCFKFEVHSQTVLSESSIEDCQQLVCVKPKVVDLQGWPPATEEQIEVKDLLQTLNAPPVSASVLVKRFDRLSDLKPLLQRYCRPIFKKSGLMKKAAQNLQWSTMTSLQMFHRYFAIEVHTQLVHLH
ncbi:MAG TPA: hypothetical protein VHD33_02400 [Legionellaceae bacterium]|nr:hypothetical protein [Legionellaceae bacterium]